MPWLVLTITPVEKGVRSCRTRSGRLIWTTRWRTRMGGEATAVYHDSKILCMILLHVG